jgi:4'-phosphopantetheinyl transferase
VHVWFSEFPERDPAARRGAGRAALEEVVGRYAPDARVILCPGRRPEVVGSPIEVSLARAGPVALVAISTEREVGVDVEEVRPAPPSAVLRHLLTDHESCALEAQPAAERQLSFARAWVRKEAALKAVGVGLAVEPCLVEVGIEPESQGVVAVPEKGVVTLRDLHVDRCVAAVAARGAASFSVRRFVRVSFAARTSARAVPARLS